LRYFYHIGPIQCQPPGFQREARREDTPSLMSQLTLVGNTTRITAQLVMDGASRTVTGTGNEVTRAFDAPTDVGHLVARGARGRARPADRARRHPPRRGRGRHRSRARRRVRDVQVAELVGEPASGRVVTP